MSKCKWLFDYHMLKDDYHESLVKLCEKMNIEYDILTYIPNYKAMEIDPFIKKPIYEKGECVVAYGCIEFLEALDTLKMNYIPSRYMEREFLTCRYYMPKIPSELLLNDDYIMLPYAEFKRNPNRIYNLFNTNNLFIRPDSGLKTFAGTTILQEDFKYEINSLENLTSVMAETIVLLSSVKTIKAEYRILVGNRKIIASSQYKRDNKLNMKEGAPFEALELANKIARLDFQPDLVYTVDIAETDDNNFKIIELNSFSAAGLYHCDPKTVLTEVSRIAELEHNQELFLGE